MNRMTFGSGIYSPWITSCSIQCFLPEHKPFAWVGVWWCHTSCSKTTHINHLTTYYSLFFFFFFFTILCSDWWSVAQLPPYPYLRTEALLISEAGSIGSQYRFPRWLSGKESACNAGDLGSIPEMERSPEVGNGTSLQYFYLENPMDREAWWATAHEVARVRHDLATKHQQNSQLRSFLGIV